MSKKKLCCLLCVFFLSLLLKACVTHQKTPQLAVGLSEQAQAREAILVLKAQGAKRQSLSGIAHLEIKVRGRFRQIQAAFRLKAPNQLSLNFLDDFGQSYASLEADGQQVEWWESTQEASEVYPQESDVFKKLFGLKISIQEFLNGLLLRLPEGEPTGIFLLSKTSSEIFRVTWPEGEAIVAADPPQLLKWTGWASRGQVKKQRPQYQVSYEYNSHFAAELPYPDKTYWLLFQPKASVTMEFSELE